MEAHKIVQNLRDKLQDAGTDAKKVLKQAYRIVDDEVRSDFENHKYKLEHDMADPDFPEGLKHFEGIASITGSSMMEAVREMYPILTYVPGFDKESLPETVKAELLTNLELKMLGKATDKIVGILADSDITPEDIKDVAQKVVQFSQKYNITVDDLVNIISFFTGAKGKAVRTVIQLVTPGVVPAKLARKTITKVINKVLQGEHPYMQFIKAKDNLQMATESKQKPQGKKGNPKRDGSGTGKRKGGNSIDWYTHYQSLLSTTSGLQWQYPNGSTTDRRNEYTDRAPGTLTYIVDDTKSVPTIAAFPLRLVESDANSTSYISRIYATLRRANSGAINYKIKNVSEYLFNIRLILAMYSSLRRAYGCISKASHTDLTRPYSLITAMGYDYNTFTQNAANLRTLLKQWAKRLETFMPYAFPIFKRTEWLFDNIYLTSQGLKDQIFILRMDVTQTFWEYLTNGQGQFTDVNVTATYPNATYTGLPYANVIAVFEQVCSNFVSENTNSIIAGDMLKAFGANNIHKLADIPEDYTVTPVFNQEVLDQISNATMTESSPTLSWTLADDSGYNGDNAIVRVSISDAYVVTHIEPKPIYLNTDKNDFSAGYVLAASRFTFSHRADQKLEYFGTEIMTGFNVVFADSTTSNPYKLDVLAYTAAVVMDTFNSTVWLDRLRVIEAIKVFDYLPKLQLSYTYVNNQSVVQIDSDGHITNLQPIQKEADVTPFIYDWTNWCPVSPSELKAIHNTAVMSLYYCPLEYKEVKTSELISN